MRISVAMQQADRIKAAARLFMSYMHMHRYACKEIVITQTDTASRILGCAVVVVALAVGIADGIFYRSCKRQRSILESRNRQNSLTDNSGVAESSGAIEVFPSKAQFCLYCSFATLQKSNYSEFITLFVAFRCRKEAVE